MGNTSEASEFLWHKEHIQTEIILEYDMFQSIFLPQNFGLKPVLVTNNFKPSLPVAAVQSQSPRSHINSRCQLICIVTGMFLVI